MGSFSIWHWVIVLLVVVVLFGGRGKLSGIMGDAAKGIRAFQKGLKGEDETNSETRGYDAPTPLPRTEAEKEEQRR
jgi:sec-independent protein translocase protein TatA